MDEMISDWIERVRGRFVRVRADKGSGEVLSVERMFRGEWISVGAYLVDSGEVFFEHHEIGPVTLRGGDWR